VPEEGSEPARSLKRSYEVGEVELLSPRLMAFEVANALRYHPVIRLDASDLVLAVTTLGDLSMTVDLRPEGWATVFELSTGEDISVYDAVYLALAVESEALFVTADVKLWNGLSDEPRKHVLPLSAFT